MKKKKKEKSLLGRVRGKRQRPAEKEEGYEGRHGCTQGDKKKFIPLLPKKGKREATDNFLHLGKRKRGAQDLLPGRKRPFPGIKKNVRMISAWGGKPRGLPHLKEKKGESTSPPKRKEKKKEAAFVLLIGKKKKKIDRFRDGNGQNPNWLCQREKGKLAPRRKGSWPIGERIFRIRNQQNRKKPRASRGKRMLRFYKRGAPFSYCEKKKAVGSVGKRKKYLSIPKKNR